MDKKTKGIEITSEAMETIAEFECIANMTTKLVREGREEVLELILMDNKIDVELYKEYLTIKKNVVEKWDDHILSEIESVGLPS
jgi:hypothetical protein